MTALQELVPNFDPLGDENLNEQTSGHLHEQGTYAFENGTPLDETVLSDYDSQSFDRHGVSYNQVQITTYREGRSVVTKEVERMRLSSDPEPTLEPKSKDIASAVYEIYWTVSAFQRSRSSNEVVLPAFGYDTGTYSVGDDDGTSITAEVFYPSEETLDAKLQDLRDKTGFAPDIARFDGNHFTLKEQADSLIEGKPLIASGLYEEPHDVLTHLPGWLALPKVTYEWIATELKQLNDKGMEVEMRNFLLHRIESCIDGDLLSAGLEATSKESTAYKVLQGTYEQLLFGSKRLSLKPHEEALRDLHITALIERVAEIQDWALEQRQTSAQM